MDTTTSSSTTSSSTTEEPAPVPPLTIDPADDDGTGSDTPAAGEAPSPTTPRPGWLGQRTLPTDSSGVVPPQSTPAELADRRFATVDVLPPPTSERFESTIGPLEGDALARSTWSDECPVAVDQLRYITMSFWGFDDRPHQGELIAHERVASDLVEVFAALYEARFPIEEMRVTSQAELDLDPTGDGNNTSAFVCRAVTGGSRFSEHAYGLAVDINPFQNPYQRGSVVLPELAASYLDRDDVRPGMILDGDVVVKAFDAIGWGWGGAWSSLLDYQHFALFDR
jgi:hypothetical protein